MNSFIHSDFLLKNKTARILFHQHADRVPVIDYHNHLNPRDIYEDKCYDNLAQVWLGGDHYKWRAMRANGISEELITGNGDPYQKFLAWADTVQNCIGNPLYHWTHMELKRYFGIDTLLNRETAPEIWEKCNALLKEPEYSIRNLLRKQKVSVLCTTDDPIDSLEWHKKLAKEIFEIKVLPTFRPGRALDIEKKDFSEYMRLLGERTEKEIQSFDDMMDALNICLTYFTETGCRVTDHSLESDFFIPTNHDEVDAIFRKRMSGAELSVEESAKYKGFFLTELGKEYARRGLAMQLHIGAVRNNSTRMFEKLGADTGFDSTHDFNYAPQLSALLNAMDITEELPKTILYYLNPKDTEMLASMAGNFQSNERGIRGKVQLGSAWWLCDHKRGMERQMNALADVGLISTFVGMLTDSRSFLSFPRHEYFRRILCNLIGTWVEDGEYPQDIEYLGKLVENVCYQNAKDYFDL